MIIGAGYSGLIAGLAWPREEICELRGPEWVEHQAVLRFRSSEIADLSGIPFRRVVVRKGIWTKGGWAAPAIDVCNRYAVKTAGRAIDRSIWNVDPVERWIAPPDFRERVIEQLGPRIHWNTRFDFAEREATPPDQRERIISTVPLSVIAPLILEDFPEGIEFTSAPITTVRCVVQDADVFQTVYFPDLDTPLYRASMTGDTLIVEFTGEPTPEEYDCATHLIFHAFGYIASFGVALDFAYAARHNQRYGKIAPIPEKIRRELILRLTKEHGIYSFGRFATWRNILLDDLIHDVAVIKRLTTSADEYDRATGK